MSDLRERERQERERERQEDYRQWLKDRSTLLSTFGTPQGRQTLRRLMEMHHFFSTTFTNSGVTAFREGERNVVLKLMDHIPGLMGEVVLERCVEMEESIRKQFHENERNSDG